MLKNHVCRAALILLIVFTSSIASVHASSDYDGDGLSDFEVVQVSKNARSNTGTTKWYVRHSSNGQIQSFSFAIPADALLRFYANGKVYPVVVWVESATKPLVWQAAGPSGVRQFRFGLPGDIIPNHQPLLGPGSATTAVVVRPQSDGTLRWFTLLADGSVPSTVFGIVGDQVAMAPDGTLLALRNDFTWWGKKFFANSLAFRRQWGLPGDIPLHPINDNQLIVSRRTGSGQVAYVLNPDGSSFTQSLGPDSSVPNVGHFFGRHQLDFAWHERSLGRVTALNTENRGAVVFAFGNASMAIVTASGQVFQPGSDSSSCHGQPVVAINSLRNVLYKPENLHGSRGPTFLVQNPEERTGSRRLTIYDIQCRAIAAFGLYATDHPYGARYYMRSGGTGQSSNQLLALAQRAGSTAILVQGQNKVIRVDNPNHRQGTIAK